MEVEIGRMTVGGQPRKRLATPHLNKKKLSVVADFCNPR
jgi:hypothetical protein